ncbi:MULTISPECIES: hypothetical protein [Halorubrum]|uniref:Diguanylate Cyclase and Two-component system sensory domain-containing protein n=1 Tax=Halorubrum ruber TaxID=2982524 RepID=A0A8T8LJQ8_9EURY|nr:MULTISPECIES: hypothetical protein [Halorubrum]QUO47060.1 hypothetical protein J7656_10680 [Halorubrum ruber]
MTLEQFLDRFDGPERSVVIVNRTDPDPVLNMLVDTFGDDAVRVVDGRVTDASGDRRLTDGAGTTGLTARELATTGVVDGEGEPVPALDVDVLRRHDDVPFDGDDPDEIENLVLLMEGDEVVAGSTLGELGDAVLFVNSDLYITGSRSLADVDLPSVISGLDDATFTLRGYPESNRQKLLLITISRFIERAAWTAGDGTLRSSFQRLSRIDDEVGTREVYERVSETGVDTHLYGVPDELPADLDAVIHAGDDPDFTDSWFVVYRPPEGPHPAESDPESDLVRGVEGGVGLLAVETEPRVWRGLWTFDADRVSRVNRYIERNL